MKRYQQRYHLGSKVNLVPMRATRLLESGRSTKPVARAHSGQFDNCRIACRELRAPAYSKLIKSLISY